MGLRDHSSSELSRSSGRSEGTSSLVASRSSSNNLSSVGKVVSSGGKLVHGNSAAVGSALSS